MSLLPAHPPPDPSLTAACAEDGSVGLAFLDSRSERNVRRMLVYDKEKRPILQVPVAIAHPSHPAPRARPRFSRTARPASARAPRAPHAPHAARGPGGVVGAGVRD